MALAAVTAAVLTTAATAGDPFDAKHKYVFAQSAHGFKLENSMLVLEDVASTLYFGDGHFGQVTNRDFVNHWGRKPDFDKQAPYAVLKTGSGKVLLTLANPQVEGSDITYEATVDGDAAKVSQGACTLFIDATRSATPTAGPEPINDRDRKAREVMAKFQEKDPELERFFKTSAGWAVYPKIAKGGFVVGGARGDGVVYAGNEVIGYSVVSQGSIGLQIGGQTYSEIVFFEDEAALNHFKAGNAELSAQASAVAVTAGASADADYADGVAVFTMAIGGAMLEASVGGQGFSFEPR